MGRDRGWLRAALLLAAAATTLFAFVCACVLGPFDLFCSLIDSLVFIRCVSSIASTVDGAFAGGGFAGGGNGGGADD